VAAPFLLGGCFNPFRPAVTENPIGTVVTSPAPRPTSSRNVMKLFKWCWENQNITLYEEILTDDFHFASAEADTEGNTSGREPDRSDELASARHIFVGGSATTPPANSISMDFRSPLIPQIDTRPGRPSPWWVRFQTDVDITIRTDAVVYRILSKAVFYAVRGDTAKIPLEFANNPAFGKNRRRWYIERYEETGLASVVYEPVGGSLRTAPRRAPPAPASAGDRLLQALGPPAAGRGPPERPTGLGPRELAITWNQLKNHYRHRR
jgi:hypothetical protein